MTTGSELAVPLGVSRAQYIRNLFMLERTRFLLARRKKKQDGADKILDALVEWDAGQDPAPNTHELSVKYNQLLDLA